MNEGEAIKELTRRMQESHREQGSSLAVLHFPKGNEPLVLVNMDDHPHLILDAEVAAKDIRTYLWERRRSRSLARARAAVWTMRDPEHKGRSWIGLAEWVRPAVADRICTRSPVFRCLGQLGSPVAK